MKLIECKCGSNRIQDKLCKTEGCIYSINWKKLLKLLKLEYIRKKSPSFFELSGGYKMSVKPYQDNSSNSLSTAIIDFVVHQGGYANRISTTGMIRKIGGEIKWTKGNSNVGAPDIRFIFQGKSGDVEIKIGADKLSAKQIKEMEMIKKAGGLAFVAKDFVSFLSWWEEIGFQIPQFEDIKTKQV
jgi:hypothetical protein